MLILQQPRRDQPQYAARWASANPLLQGALRLWDFGPGNASFELITGDAPVETGLSRTPGRAGVGRALTAASGTTWNDNYRSQITDQLTWFLVAEFTSTVNGFLLGNVQPTGVGYNHGLYADSSDLARFFVKTAGAGSAAIGTTPLSNKGPMVIVGTYDGANVRIYVNGKLEGTTAKTGNVDTTDFETSLGQWNNVFQINGNAYSGGVLARAWTANEVLAFGRTADEAYGSQFAPRGIFVPVSAGGGGSHDATGAMSAQSATVSGSAAAVATYTSSGALTAQAATVAGSATHVAVHGSIGVLEAQAATVAGSADHSAAGAVSATGALTAQVATVAGSAAHLTLHTATGALVADSATAAGSAVHYTLHTATGDLAADAASVGGAALHSGDGAEVARPFTGAGRHRRTRQRVVVEIDGEDFIAASSEEAQAILDQAKEAAEEKAKVAIERATKARNRPTRKVMADARKALELPAISAPDLGGYAEEISRQIEDIYQSAIQTIEVAALLRKRELEEEDDEDILLLIA